MNKTQTISRKEIISPFIASIICAFVIYFGLTALAPVVAENSIINGYGDMIEKYAAGEIFAKAEYLMFDISQFTFLFSPLAIFVMFILALLASHLERTGSKFMGTGVDGNSAVYPMMLLFSLVFTFLGQEIYGDYLATLGFVPTLSTYLFFQHYVLYYGVSWKKILTIGIFTTLLATPACLLARMLVVDTLEQPMFISIAIGALIFMPVCNMVFRLMPWMTARDKSLEPSINRPKVSKFTWFINQLLGDVGQLAVSGSSISSIGLIAFVIISYLLNPNSATMGLGLLPIVLFCMIATGALSIFIFYPYYDKMPVLSFGSMVTVCAFAVTHPMSLGITVVSILYSAIVPVALTAWVFKVSDYKGEYCVFPLVMIAIAASVIPFSLFIRLILIPLGF